MTKYKQEVFKLQRPVMTNAKQVMILAYNKDRSALGEFPITDRLRKLFGNEYKIYVQGYLDEQGQIILVDLVKPEDEPSW
jgi:hypothetical protein